MGINLEVPIEDIDLGIVSSATALQSLDYRRTLFFFDPSDYDGVVGLPWEVVATNGDSSARSVSIVDVLNNAVCGTISVPAGSVKTRVRSSADFAPLSGKREYFYRIDGTTSGGQFSVFTARRLVQQQNATKTRIWYPLVQQSSNVALGQTFPVDYIMQNNVWAQITPAFYSLFHRDDSRYGDVRGWSFEAVMECMEPGTMYCALFNAATTVTNPDDPDTEISGGEIYESQLKVVASATVSDDSQVYIRDSYFDGGVGNFVDGGDYQVLLRGTFTDLYKWPNLYRACLYIQLTNLSQSESYYRVAKSGSDTTTSRVYIDTTLFSNPAVLQESTGRLTDVTAGAVYINDESNIDTGPTSGLVIPGSAIAYSSTTKQNIRSNIFSITDQHRFTASSSYGRSDQPVNQLIVVRAGVVGASCQGVSPAIDQNSLIITGTGTGSTGSTRWRVVRTKDGAVMAVGTGDAATFTFQGELQTTYQLQFATNAPKQVETLTLFGSGGTANIAAGGVTAALATYRQHDTLTITGDNGTANITAGGVTKTITLGAVALFVSTNAAAYLAAGITLTNTDATLNFDNSVTGVGFTSPTITTVTGNCSGIIVNSSLALVASDWVAANATAYAGVGITIGASGSTIMFTETVAGTGFVSPTIATVDPDLDGTIAHTQPSLNQVNMITLTGSSGTATLDVFCPSDPTTDIPTTLTWHTDLSTTASDYVTSNAPSFLAEGLILTSDGATLTFASTQAANSFPSPIIENVTTDLSGTFDDLTALNGGFSTASCLFSFGNALCTSVSASLDAATMTISGSGVGSPDSVQWRVVRVNDGAVMANGTGNSAIFSFIGTYATEYQLQFA